MGDGGAGGPLPAKQTLRQEQNCEHIDTPPPLFNVICQEESGFTEAVQLGFGSLPYQSNCYPGKAGHAKVKDAINAD